MGLGPFSLNRLKKLLICDLYAWRRNSPQQCMSSLLDIIRWPSMTYPLGLEEFYSRLLFLVSLHKPGLSFGHISQCGGTFSF